VFIARQDISASQVESLTEAFTKTLEDQGGKVAKVEQWGLRGLAYKIKKNRKGHYVLFNIDGPAAAVQEMERQMRINEDVLRYITIRVDELEEGPSAMMQHRSGRDDRPRRGDRFDRGQGPREPAAKATNQAEAGKAEPEAAAEGDET
jgi:small subunit ribosomal protein S6